MKVKSKKELTLEDIFKDYDGKSVAKEFDWGSTVGKEIIMGKYMENESLDAAVCCIVENELSGYKERLKNKIFEHFANAYCAKTDFGKVIYEEEILDLIEKA